jgi:type IX secretion system PorP/SprF family membrane protein
MVRFQLSGKLTMKKNIFILLLVFSISMVWEKSGSLLFAQQLPYYTQFKTNMYMINPGITGTKRTVDARLNHRIQWVGDDGAPKTTAFSVHNRFKKGKMGLGLSFLKDEIGPSQQMAIGASYAYHIRFPDVELSLGGAGHVTKYTFDGSKTTVHNAQDPAINMGTSTFDWVPDASFGLYLYNDRFHFGASALHFMEREVELYKADTAKKGIIKYATHVNVTLGYNYSNNPDYVMENTIYANYVTGVPVMLDYTVRLHYKSKVFAGVSFRLKDAVALHVGATLFDYLQISYSYDVLISKLKPYSKGSHEIMLSFSHNVRLNKSKFIHQRYAYMF